MNQYLSRREERLAELFEELRDAQIERDDAETEIEIQTHKMRQAARVIARCRAEIEKLQNE